MRHAARLTIAAAVIGLLGAGCAPRRDDRIASSPTGAAVANPRPAYGAKVQPDHRTSHDDERLRAAIRERYGEPAPHRATTPPAHGATKAPARDAGTASAHDPATGVPVTAADQRLAARVQRTLAADRETRHLDLAVRARHGVVTVTGHVRTAAQKRKALELARGVAGATRVHDAITVGAPARH